MLIVIFYLAMRVHDTMFSPQQNPVNSCFLLS